MFDQEKILEILNESRLTRAAKNELCTGRNLIINIADNKGEKKHDSIGIVTVATKFYKELCRKKEENCEEENCREQREKILQILIREVKNSIKKLNIGKAAGPDKIENEFLKKFGNELAKPLTRLFNRVLSEETIPHQWKLADIILLFKKGDRNNISNYRPISLTSNTS